MKLLSLVLVGGCAASLDPASVTPLLSDDAVFLLDDDVQALVGHDGTATATYLLGAAPGRLARAGGTVWVTLPAERGIAVLEQEREEGGDFRMVRADTLETGAAPMGIAVTPDGTRIYVALTSVGEVHELDAAGGVSRRWAIEGEPTWVALHPDGNDLYVGSAFGGHITWIDLESGVASAVELPPTSRTVRVPSRSVDVLPADVVVQLTPRVTGDLSVSPNGGRLAVPLLLVDNATPIDAPNDTDEAESSNGNSNGYGSDPSENDSFAISRMNAAVALIPISGDGEPRGTSADIVPTAGLSREVSVRSYLSSATFSPDGTVVLATMEASNAVVAFKANLVSRESSTGGFTVEDTQFVGTAAGPRSVLFSDDTVYVDCFLDRQIDQFPLLDLLEDSTVERGDTGKAIEIREQLFATLADHLQASPLDDDLRQGRSLFYSAVNTHMAGASAGVSCSTCHLSGRNDGLSWNLESGLRQTPSLVGGISDTAPFTWASGVKTVEDEVEITSQGRMGGEDLAREEAGQVALYIESLSVPDHPLAGSSEPDVLRGAEIFWRADVGCATCHYGAAFTDNQDWSLFEMDAVNTPSLRGLAVTAPYLHDGRASTIGDVLSLAVAGEMGDASMLSTGELEDLEAYLLSL